MQETQTVVTRDSVIEGLKTIVALNGNDIDSALDQMGVEPKERAEAKKALGGLLKGDETLLRELSEELSSEERDGSAVERGGGKTAFKVLKKWRIPYGFRLYIAHDIIREAISISTLVTSVTALCGPKGAVLAAGIAIGIAALKLLDRGSGIMITQIPMGVGPCIPTPQ